MKINFHKLIVYNQGYGYIGTILGSIGTYFECAKTENGLRVWVLLLSGLFFLLMAFKKPKKFKEE
jgi:hypothetical protein